MFKFAKLAVLSGALISSGFTYANIITDLYSVDYRMGANESRQSAREGAIAQITEQAITKMGSHIIVTKALDGDQYSESVDMLGASLLKVNVISDAISDADGQSVLTIKAEVSLDERELEKRLARIDADIQTQAKLEDMTRKNMLLRRQLIGLQSRNKDNMTHLEIAKLENRQREILLEMNHLRKNSKIVFEPGYLLQSARIKKEHEDAIESARIEAERLLEQARQKERNDIINHGIQTKINDIIAINETMKVLEVTPYQSDQDGYISIDIRTDHYYGDEFIHVADFRMFTGLDYHKRFSYMITRDYGSTAFYDRDYDYNHNGARSFTRRSDMIQGDRTNYKIIAPGPFSLLSWVANQSRLPIGFADQVLSYSDEHGVLIYAIVDLGNEQVKIPVLELSGYNNKDKSFDTFNVNRYFNDTRRAATYSFDLCVDITDEQANNATAVTVFFEQAIKGMVDLSKIKTVKHCEVPHIASEPTSRPVYNWYKFDRTTDHFSYKEAQEKRRYWLSEDWYEIQKKAYEDEMREFQYRNQLLKKGN